MNTVSTVKNLAADFTSKFSSRILSGGDEKVLRLFEAPYNFVKTINSLNPNLSEQSQIAFSKEHSNKEVEQMIESDTKKQALGLMNKPAVLLANKGTRVDEKEAGVGEDFDPVSVLSNKKTEEIIHVAEPPVEDVLMARTLWPEQ